MFNALLHHFSPSSSPHTLISTFRVSAASSTATTSRSTLLTTFFFILLLEILLPIAMGHALGAPSLSPIAQAGCLLATASLSMKQLVMSIAHDRMLTILHLVFLRSPLPLPYWGGQFLTAAGIGALSGSACLLTTQMWAGFHLLPWLFLLPCALCGSFVGIFLAGWGILLTDIYAPLNGITPFLALTTGLLVPYEAYPRFFAIILPYLPLSSMIQLVRSPHVLSIGASLRYDLVLCFLCSLCGIGVGTLFTRRLRSGLTDYAP